LKANRMPKIAISVLIILLTSIVIFTVFAFTVKAQSTFQTWEMVATTEGGSYSGTLNVQSDGDFTSSGFTGSTPSGSYPIDVEGLMSGTSVSLTITAYYDSGNGQIYGSGDGTLNAKFPSATYASGTISGTISDPLGARGFSMSWTATKTSGGSSGGGGLGLFDDDSIVDVVPFIIAGAVGIALISVSVAVVKVSKAKRQQRMQAVMGHRNDQEPVQWRESHPRNYQYEQPHSPGTQALSGIQGSLNPQPITSDHGVPITGEGISVVPPGLGTLPFLNGVWEPGRATLTWGTPQFDRSKYVLLGYDISQSTYGPASTAAQDILLFRSPPGSNSAIIQPFNQTYRWNTAGDIGGFRVDPVFGELNPQGQVGAQFRYGGLGIRVGQSMGTFGV